MVTATAAVVVAMNCRRVAVGFGSMVILTRALEVVVDARIIT